MENNLNLIKQFPDKIKKVNLKNEKNILDSLSEYDLFTIDLETDIKTKTQLYGKKENKIYVFDEKLEIQHQLITTKEDQISHFGYCYFFYNYKLYISGFNNKGYPFFYIYNTDDYELVSKILLQNFIGPFYGSIINKKMYLVQVKDLLFTIHTFKLINDELIKDDIIRIELQNDSYKFSILNNFILISNNNLLFTIDINNYQIKSKIERDIKIIETFFFQNLDLTVIVNDSIEILDSNLNTRQIINLNNIKQVLFSNSYLIFVNSQNIIYLYASDENGLFVQFGIIDNIEEIDDACSCYDKIFIKNQKTISYNLPKRIYNLSKFVGYGFYMSNEFISKCNYKPIFTKNGKLTSHYDSNSNYSLVVGFTNKISEIFSEDKTSNYFSVEYEFVNNLSSILSKDYVIISDDFEFSSCLLDKEKSNLIFIDSFNYELYIKSSEGSFIEVIINKYKKIITWSKDSILKLEICNNHSIIEIYTNSDVEILGFINNKDTKKFNYDIKTVTNSDDILVNSKILSDYNTFLPYYDGNNIQAIVTNKISNIDTQFKFITIKSNLIEFNKISKIDFNNLNQQFYQEYLIENNDKSIIINDLYSDKQIIEFKTKDIGNINKIIYVNPLMIILSKSKIDTSLHLVNVNNNNIIPYIINNTSSENLTNLFCYSNSNLVFVSEKESEFIIYIVNLDDSNEVNNMRKIIQKEIVTNLKLSDNLLIVEIDKKEIIIYDIENMQTLLSITDENLLDFDIFYDHFVLITKEEKNIKLHIYKIKPEFELFIEKNIDQLNTGKINFGPNKLLINDDNKIVIYNFDEINGLIKIDTINETFIHYYKNILVTEIENQFKIYQFSPKLIYLDNHINCQTYIDSINLKNKEEINKSILNLFLEVDNKSKIKIENRTIDFRKFCNNKCIVKLILEIEDEREIKIESINKSAKLCALIEGVMKDKLPCFIPGTLILTPNGEVPIENLKENDIIYNDKMEEIPILSVHKWQTSEYTKNNIPYMIPANSLKQEYPKYDTGISPFHKIKLPNGDFKRVEEIKLPFIKQFRDESNNLRSNNKIIEKIVYYNFILNNNSYFIANGLIVESLDKSNSHL